MIVVGLTGGIGSGKTTVARQFNALGTPVYIADVEAKKLMSISKTIKRKLTLLFGEEAYVNGELNKPFIAETIFNDKTYLDKMNTIVHPKVAQHFYKWLLKQKAPYVLKESAILFEGNSYKQCDLIILVTAPKSLRIKRLLQRDNTTKAKIQAIMDNQWSDEDKMKDPHYVIVNDTLVNVQRQVLDTHEKILKKLQ